MEGNKIENFTLNGIDEHGRERKFTLKELFGDRSQLVLYFYPKDNTPGCTMEACNFKENLNRILPYASVAGVSADPIESHKRFREKYGLNFPLLSDPQLSVIKELGAYGEKNMYGKKIKGIIRSTFVLAKNGKIVKEWRNVKVNGHIDEVINFLKEKKLDKI
jgi:peroxiredoxin Q/BCP